MCAKDSFSYCPDSCCDSESPFFEKVCYFEELDQCGEPCDMDFDCGDFIGGVCCYLQCDFASTISSILF